MTDSWALEKVQSNMSFISIKHLIKPKKKRKERKKAFLVQTKHLLLVRIKYVYKQIITPFNIEFLVHSLNCKIIQIETSIIDNSKPKLPITKWKIINKKLDSYKYYFCHAIHFQTSTKRKGKRYLRKWEFSQA